ncbi:MAG: hypothetical protein NXI24_15690 [bacterium]|nr:hypothetical protein [bacterium]
MKYDRNIKALKAAVVAALIFVGVGRCSVHVDDDRFFEGVYGKAAIYLATVRACSNAANESQSQAARDVDAALCALGVYAIDRDQDDDD